MYLTTPQGTLQSEVATVIELVLSEECLVPTVQCFTGPKIKITMNVEDDMRKVLAFLHAELAEAMKWAVNSLYSDTQAPARIYVRDVQGNAMSVMTDPCQVFGLNALVRTDDFQRFENFGR